MPVLDELGAKLNQIYGKKNDEPKPGSSQSSKSVFPGQFQPKVQQPRYPLQEAPLKSKTPPRAYNSHMQQQTPLSPPVQQQQQPQNKWKMSFAKDEPRAQNTLGRGTKSGLPSMSNQRTQPFVVHDSDDDGQNYRNRQPRERRIPSPLKQFGRTTLTRSPPPRAPPVKSGPVVLDKFGNFR